MLGNMFFSHKDAKKMDSQERIRNNTKEPRKFCKINHYVSKTMEIKENPHFLRKFYSRALKMK